MQGQNIGPAISFEAGYETVRSNRCRSVYCMRDNSVVGAWRSVFVPLIKPDKETAKLLAMTPAEQVNWIKKGMGIQSFMRPTKYWLDTGSRYLNGVLGSEEKGLAYGKSITLAGLYSTAKTLLGILLGGMAQHDGAEVAIVDLENGEDREWAGIHGLRYGKRYANGGYSKIALFQPEIGIFSGAKGQKKKKGRSTVEMRLQTAEELFRSVTTWMILQRRLGKEKVFVLVDSTTAIQPEEEIMHEFDEMNMRTDMALPKFLNKLTKRWNQVALNTNAIIVYISQIRINPMQMFGNPEKIPGGMGILYYPSVICKVRRYKKGIVLQNGQPVGIQSVIHNIKNKAGAGSVEGKKCAFRAKFSEYDWHFMGVKKLEGEQE